MNDPYSRRSRLLAGAAALTIATALVPAAAASTDAPASPSRASDPGWVTGVVVDTEGDPVEGALVHTLRRSEVPESGLLADQTDRRTWTGSDGAFRVRMPATDYLLGVCDPEPGTEDLACRETAQGVRFIETYLGPDGLTDSWVTQQRLFSSTTADRAVGTIEAQPQSFVKGRIRGLANQGVRLMRLNDTSAYYSDTNARGRYSFQGLAPGRYYVRGGGEGTLEWRSPVVSVPRAGTVRVNGKVARGGVIRGRLLSAGKPVRGEEVLFRKAGGPLIAGATTDVRGRYRVSGLRPGAYAFGILRPGSAYEAKRVRVRVSGAETVERDLRVRRGAVIEASTDPSAGKRISAELRTARGKLIAGEPPIRGVVSYAGLSPGKYVLHVANEKRYAKRRIEVTRRKTYDLGVLGLDKRTLTLRGRTAPGAVIEVTTSTGRPFTQGFRPGGFVEIEKAGAKGRYRVRGLVPGVYTIGADGWPANYAPRTQRGVRIRKSTRRDIDLKEGATVSGRLRYADNGRPLVAHLSYGLTYLGSGLDANAPTDEHPPRVRVKDPRGAFTVERIGTGSYRASLANESGDNISDLGFIVIHPFQDGRPYYLDTLPVELDLQAGQKVELGTVPVRLRGTQP